MCFSPVISLITAIVEFAVAGYILTNYKTKTSKLWALFIIVLGIYQLTEFLMCNFGTFFARIGFIAYTILPALGLHFFIILSKRTSKRKFTRVIFYIPWIIFSTVALFAPNFIISKSCTLIFENVRTLFFNFQENIILTILYLSYYFGFIFFASLMAFRDIKKEKNKLIKKNYGLAVLAIMISLIAALILIIIFPFLGVMFPSVYCEFAVVFTIFAIIAVRLEK
jgi:hypothetical protein